MLLMAGAMGSTVGASARAPLLLQAQLQALNDNRYVAIKNWISNAQTDELMCDALAVRRFGGTYDCHIGDRAGGQGGARPPPDPRIWCKKFIYTGRGAEIGL